MPQAVVTTFTDITLLKVSEQALVQAQQVLTEERDFARLVMSTMGQGLTVADLQARISFANPAFCKLLGYNQAELVGKTYFDIIPQEDHAQFEQNRRLREQGQASSYEISMRRADGTVLYVHVTGVPYRQNNQLVGIVTVVTDVSQRKRAQLLLERQANYDLLTNLPNRMLFRQRLDYLLSQAEIGNSRVAVGFIDLDGFKGVNDTLGHAAGDLLLQQVARRLTDCLDAPDDLIARMGGDEFTLILTDVATDTLLQANAERILATLHQPFDLDGQTVQIGASIGFAVYPYNGLESTALLQKADATMYEVKMNGKSNFAFAKEV